MSRTPKYKTEKALSDAIDEYFDKCEEQQGKAPNKAGLCIHLDISRETYNQYRTRYPDAIKTADDLIEDWWVDRLAGTTPTGAIFYLKNAFHSDYKDRHENDNTHRFDKLEVDDLRALISVLPEQEQEKYYELIAKLAAIAGSAGGSPKDKGFPVDRSGNDSR